MKILMSTPNEVYEMFSQNAPEEATVIYCSDNELEKAATEHKPDFLIFEINYPAIKYRGKLLNLYKNGVYPYIVAYQCMNSFVYATSNNNRKGQSIRAKYLSSIISDLKNSLQEAGYFFSEAKNYTPKDYFAGTSASFEKEENLRELLGGIPSIRQFEMLKNTYDFNLYPGMYLFYVTITDPDGIIDYKFNRSIYYLLEELQKKNIKNILDNFYGGEFFPGASKKDSCILFNFPANSGEALLQRIKMSLYNATNDGISAQFMSAFIPEPNLINAAYKSCYLYTRYKVFFRETKVLGSATIQECISDKNRVSFSTVTEAVEAVRKLDINAEPQMWESAITHLFIDCVKPSVNINYLQYACSALNIIYAELLKQYAEIADPSAILDNYEKGRSVEDIAGAYIKAFTEACSNIILQTPEGNLTIMKIKSFINRNYSKELTLEMIAAEVYMNPSYLSRKFNKATGVNIHTYIEEVRINKSKELLSDTDYKILEIAQMCGYANPMVFSRAFFRRTNQTPSEYRKAKQRIK